MIGSSWTPSSVSCCAAPTQEVSRDLTNLDIIQTLRHRKFLEDAAAPGVDVGNEAGENSRSAKYRSIINAINLAAGGEDGIRTHETL